LAGEVTLNPDKLVDKIRQLENNMKILQGAFKLIIRNDKSSNPLIDKRTTGIIIINGDISRLEQISSDEKLFSSIV